MFCYTEILAKDIHSILFCCTVSDERKSLITLALGWYADRRSLYIVHNGQKSLIEWTDNYNGESIIASFNTYFALHLNPGDSIKINSGSADIYLGVIKAKFTGFLLNKDSETSQTPDMP
jgi:hypothetical protein